MHELICGLCLTAGLMALMLETNWMRVRLLAGREATNSLYLLLNLIDCIADGDDIYNMRCQLARAKGVIDWSNETYQSIVSWDWLKLHWDDAQGQHQTIEIDAYGVSSKITLYAPDTKIIKDVMKALKPSKALKQAYAN